MKTIGEGLKAHLAEDATTLCHAWRLTRRDGVVLGFTDHDHDLTFDATMFQAASGYQASDREALSGLAAPSADVVGALSSDAITDKDIAAGKYDGARVELFLVNWDQPSQHTMLKVQEIGEITRSESHFRAELRSVAHKLSQTRGRIYGHRCDAAFGDGRCGKNANAFRATGTVASAPDLSRMTVHGLGEFANGYFRYGMLTFTSGVNDGVSVDIESHVQANAAVTLVFWLPVPAKPANGDTFKIIAGCDKSIDTCRSKFDNVANFRGFPHIPGADFTYAYADGETEHDGAPLYE
ncbi:DUF2163 domain-containing protein [Rhizobium sp. KVB221]|uniref:DUF2163 domain-containing protein n=1 Tax=Rhizobium setariae TaxID=2801340 RepID=A0A937CML9_9HYPH|nr:DUF2163 domain-containing protein [Rhizobium setariae]MBL0371079.1 DUF2163 domain-containing protein [Rhizobium setariae]